MTSITRHTHTKYTYAYEYAAVKQVMIKEFSEVVNQDGYIRRAMDCKLQPLHMAASVTDTDVFFKKTGFNDEAKFRLLTIAVMERMDLAQYALLQGASAYESLKRVLETLFAAEKLSAQRVLEREKKRVSKFTL